MARKLSILAVVVFLGCVGRVDGGQYEATWQSLDKRAIPQWFQDAKFGIFIHWGVYSVPSWVDKGQYAEWYLCNLNSSAHGVKQFHNRVYGKDFKYDKFAEMFKAELFEPGQWADIFKRSGAKYVVMTSKHHEGFAMWPSRYGRQDWNSGNVGPRRDLCGDLIKAVRKEGLRMGFYYSLMDWYAGSSIVDGDYIEKQMLPQLRELVTRYKPDILWADGNLEHTSDVWKTREFLAWVFNESEIKDEVVVNDRWGKEIQRKHGGFYTTEYGSPEEIARIAALGRYVEECRGMGASFGFNRNETIDEYTEAKDLVHTLVKVVSGGGNLLLNIGPTADGRIPVIMQERLLQVGKWLDVNGQAIYGTRPWRELSEKSGDTSVYYTSKDGAVYAVCLSWPGRRLTLTAPKADGNSNVSLLGHDCNLTLRKLDKGLVVDVPALSVDEGRCRYAYVFKLTGVR